MSETHLLYALKAHAPQVLEALRDAVGDDEAKIVEDWARAYGIAYPRVLKAAKYLRGWWHENPHKAKDLRLITVVEALGVYRSKISPAEQQWLANAWPTFKPPDPDAELLGEWLQRAKDLYLDRERAAGVIRSTKERRYRGRSDETVWRAYGWFVRIHVAGRDSMYQAKVAREDRVSAATVSRGIKSVKAELGADNYLVRIGRRRGAKDRKPRKERSDAL